MANRKANGMSPTPEYAAWIDMRRRCRGTRESDRRRYTDRGITVCPDWDRDDGFAAFLAHVGPRPSPQHQLDRVDNDKGYQPGNVRWATPTENTNNRSTTVIVEHAGERLPLTEWARRLGVHRDTLQSRIERWGSVEKALTAPVTPRGTGPTAIPCPACGRDFVPRHGRARPGCSAACSKAIRAAAASARAA